METLSTQQHYTVKLTHECRAVKNPPQGMEGRMSQHTPGPPNAIKMTPGQEIQLLLDEQLSGGDLTDETRCLIAKAPEMAALLSKVIRWKSGEPIQVLLDEARALRREIEGNP